MKKKTAKKLAYLAIIVIIIGAFMFFKKPSYPQIVTPTPILGNPDASIRIVEFADFQCPACGSAHPTMKQIIEDYGDSISYEFKHFPLSSIHPYADKAAQAAECAADQGQFYEYADLLFANQNSLQDKFLKDYADQLGLDTESFSACLGSNTKQAIVNGEVREGQGQGVRGTPTVFLNGQAVSWQSLGQEIENRLNS